MPPRDLFQAIANLPGFGGLLLALDERQPLPGLGVPRAARLPLLAVLREHWQGPLLLVTARADQALRLHDELAFWLPPDVPRHLFREPTPLFYEIAAWDAVTRRDRIAALHALAGYHLPWLPKPAIPPVIVASVRALMVRTMPRRDFIRAEQVLRVGGQARPRDLTRAWLRMGYRPADLVVEPGQFSHRGGLLDIWPLADPRPLRLEFFGDELESLRRFDPASQRTLQRVDQAVIMPAREYLLPEDVWNLPEDEQPAEFDLPRLHTLPSSLFDYLPANGLVLFDDRSLLETIAGEVEEQAIKMRGEAVRNGLLPEDFPVPYWNWPELEDAVLGRPWLELGYTLSGDTFLDLAEAFEPEQRFGGQLKKLMDWLDERLAAGERALLVSRQDDRLREVWARTPRRSAAALQVENGILAEGFVLRPSEGTVWHVLSDAEIFGWKRPHPRTPPRQAAEAPESLYADLKPGDYVVHVDYGIGRFAGLVQRELDGLQREFLLVEYQDGDQLFVPVHQADRLTRYVGPDGRKPEITRLHGSTWQQTRQRVRQAVQEVAADLLDLYAARQVTQGHAFSPDTEWQHELENAFPYVETPDQARVLAEIKRDMESPRPMDRLLCGDVGYGKTEVALRAAFKAVMDGKQVVMLVPTTVLAQQHYETFRERLRPFPVRVEMLSRFRTASEQTSILYALAQGEIDIIIGTHRLLQGDVQFKDLGLVIIDEEQRFGVAHKEYFKKMRTEVDVLTLTATPIPRTLYMALTGVRDISMLTTPPEERQPIVTHVGPYDPRLVRQAILRELERGGQVFFVHNRVQTIRAMQSHLQQLVPEARIAVGHGQMPEKKLADVMRRFAAGEVDVLLSTTIIESGLDIPNANTLIVDRADTFGLAQLYQLRGRVGRGAARAYAYFFRHRKKAPTPEGQERLEVLAENTQLGAGYAIAMRDLEIRGAGDLLGVRQHGHIAAVGFHLYTRLLADAVRALRADHGAKISAALDRALDLPLAVPVNVELPLATGLPADYIPDAGLRLQLYRRIADLRSLPDLDALEEEFADRFGEPPAMVRDLLYQMRIKLLAEKAGLASVDSEGGQIVLRYPVEDGRQPPQLPDLAPDVRGGRGAFWCRLGERWQARLLEILQELSAKGRLP